MYMTKALDVENKAVTTRIAESLHVVMPHHTQNIVIQSPTKTEPDIK